MCHKERKLGTMVERIQPVSAANFLYPPPLVIAAGKSQINTVPMLTVAWTWP